MRRPTITLLDQRYWKSASVSAAACVSDGINPLPNGIVEQVRVALRGLRLGVTEKLAYDR
jgi:hypothetical protein